MICPNCDKVVEELLTDHGRPGIFNCCRCCISHPFKGLRELNNERKVNSTTEGVSDE